MPSWGPQALEGCAAGDLYDGDARGDVVGGESLGLDAADFGEPLHSSGAVRVCWPLTESAPTTALTRPRCRRHVGHVLG